MGETLAIYSSMCLEGVTHSGTPISARALLSLPLSLSLS